MIKRVVKMVFREEAIADFHTLFDERMKFILSQEGCHKVQMLQDDVDPKIHFTISIWDSVEDLNRYRHTPFFGETWKATKALFDGRPEAWSLNLINEPK